MGFDAYSPGFTGDIEVKGGRFRDLKVGSYSGYAFRGNLLECDLFPMLSQLFFVNQVG